jgi:hypothetical protein
MMIQPDGKVGIGTTASGYLLHVNGSVGVQAYGTGKGLYMLHYNNYSSYWRVDVTDEFIAPSLGNMNFSKNDGVNGEKVVGYIEDDEGNSMSRMNFTGCHRCVAEKGLKGAK